MLEVEDTNSIRSLEALPNPSLIINILYERVQSNSTMFESEDISTSTKIGCTGKIRLIKCLTKINIQISRRCMYCTD